MAAVGWRKTHDERGFFRMKSRVFLPLLALCLLLLPIGAAAQWTTIASGIEYQHFVLPGPNDMHVARMTIADTSAIIDSCLSQGDMGGSRETVSGMANRYDEAIGYWGEEMGKYRNDVKIAINGDFWDIPNSVSESGQIISGWYSKRFNNFGGRSGLAWKLNRTAFIGGCVNHVANKNYASYPSTGQTQNINGVNVARGNDQLILYTPQRNETTGTDNTGVEVVVEMARPTMVLPSPSFASGTVREIRNGLGNTFIPFDHVVLSGKGTATTKLLALSVGAEVRISQEITHYQIDECTTSNSNDWTKTYASVAGNYSFLRSSVVFTGGTNAGLINQDPRTAVALNSTYVFFLVVDGRRPGSVGMSMTDLGNFCLGTLGATDGVNLDGGGSSAMWVNGSIVNVPSDGSERATYNGFMMISLLPKSQTTTYTAGANVQAPSGATIRLGPGSNYGALGSVGSGAAGVVQSHALNGILAKGSNWWKVNFSGTTGWVAASQLILAPGVEAWQVY